MAHEFNITAGLRQPDRTQSNYNPELLREQHMTAIGPFESEQFGQQFKKLSALIRKFGDVF